MSGRDFERGVKGRTLAQAMTPPLITVSGRTPKFWGCQRTRSASFPGEMSPITLADERQLSSQDQAKIATHCDMP